jgi:hypothetical protein
LPAFGIEVPKAAKGQAAVAGDSVFLAVFGLLLSEPFSGVLQGGAQSDSSFGEFIELLPEEWELEGLIKVGIQHPGLLALNLCQQLLQSDSLRLNVCRFDFQCMVMAGQLITEQSRILEDPNHGFPNEALNRDGVKQRYSAPVGLKEAFPPLAAVVALSVRGKPHKFSAASPAAQ